MAEELKIHYRAVGELVPYGRNARTHSEAQVAQLVESIRRFGFTNPLLVDGENGIIAGHGRLLAARAMGLPSVPVIELAHLTDAERRAYIIADNRLAEEAGWDEELLRLELGDLAALDFDLSFTGFTEDEIAAVLHGVRRAGLTDEDAAPPLERAAISRPGDVWLLGDHRVICGSSTEAGTVERLLQGAVPHLMVTDPPYGVNYDPAWRQKALGGHGGATGRVLNDHIADWGAAWALFQGAVAYVWHAGTKAHTVAESLMAQGFEIRAQICWVKQRHVLSRGHYHAQHEPCFLAERTDEPSETPPDLHEIAAYAVKDGTAAGWVGGRKQSTVWFIEHLRNDTGHPTQKPVECMRRPIENNSQLGQAVYDPFLGSGTTVVAAETTQRACYGVELNPAYVDVTVKRWETFTGREAVLEGRDQTFHQVTTDRAAGP